MAPKKKAGQTRRDAAMDAMRKYGFEDALIRKTLNELLKIYGRDNWAFIETDCYKVLLETILEKLEQERLKLDDNPNEENFAEFHHDLPPTKSPENIRQEVPELEEMDINEEEMNQVVMNDGHEPNMDFDLNELPPNDDDDQPSS